MDVGQGDRLLRNVSGRPHRCGVRGGALGSFHCGGNALRLDVGERVVSPLLVVTRLKQIEVVALTHGATGSSGGLPAILKNVRVRELWVGRDIGSHAYQQVLALPHRRSYVML